MNPSGPRLWALAALILTLAACSGTVSGSPVTGGSPSVIVVAPPPIATPVPTAATSPSGSHVIGPLPSDFDPCTLLTPEQATAVNGLSYGAGTPHALHNGLVECVWGHSTPPGSITVQVLVAPSTDAAATAFAASQVDLHGFDPQPVPSFFQPLQSDQQAVIARAPAGTISTGGIYVQDGAAFFDVVYLGGAAPSDEQLRTAALLVRGAIP